MIAPVRMVSAQRAAQYLSGISSEPLVSLRTSDHPSVAQRFLYWLRKDMLIDTFERHSFRGEHSGTTIGSLVVVTGSQGSVNKDSLAFEELVCHLALQVNGQGPLTIHLYRSLWAPGLPFHRTDSVRGRVVDYSDAIPTEVFFE